MKLEKMMEEMLKDENVKREYDALEPEFQILHAMLDARMKENLTQQQLADRIGVDRADISKLENGNANPSLRMLKRIAEGLGRKLSIEFLPKDGLRGTKK